MVHTDTFEIEHISEKNDASWINVPIMYEDNLVDPKKYSLRHWKHILRSSNNKTASIVTPKFPSLSKRISSQYDSLDSHTHEKQLLRKDLVYCILQVKVILHHCPHHEDFKPQLLRAWEHRGSSRTSLFGE
ncbi:hypothetical protein SO802_024411 [Lithocarpus litseifolius]|uniref:Uncharacterized protein n=1 Tax=Lithocarpus litseifolius TaxID=425828 RepID=A0AAW2CAI4_9ROSI